MFLVRLDLPRRLRDGLYRRLPKSDYSVVGLSLLLIALLLTGGRRISHLRMLQHDPIVSRFCGLDRLPTDRSVSRWLSQFDAVHVDALQQINERVTAEVIHALGLRRLTLDVDGSVVSTGLSVEGPRRGYNLHRRKVPSYFPITAYEAQSGLLLRVENRPGNIHDGQASIAFLEALIAQVKADLPDVRHLEFRLDGAFFLKEILACLDRAGAEYAVKVPFWRWLDLRERIAYQKRWHRVSEGLDCFETSVGIDPWQRRERVVIYRNATAKNYQLDLFDPDDGTWEYSAIATNKTLTGPALWQFMSGRGTHEKVYGELKTGFAFDCVPSFAQAACQQRLASVQCARLQSLPRHAGFARNPASRHERKARSAHLLSLNPHPQVRMAQSRRTTDPTQRQDHARRRLCTHRAQTLHLHRLYSWLFYLSYCRIEAKRQMRLRLMPPRRPR